MGSTPDAADSPEDRLIRAIVLARSPEVTDRKAATEQLERLLADLPREFAASALSRRVLTELYIESGQLAKARAQAEIDAQDNTNPSAIAVYASSLIREGMWDLAGQTGIPARRDP